MDEVDILKGTLNNTLQRISKIIANYEIEVANLTAEVIRLQGQLESNKDSLSNT